MRVLARPERRPGLRYLTRYWAERLLENQRVHLIQVSSPSFPVLWPPSESTASTARILAQHLWREHRILVSHIGHRDCKGIRVTPAVFTTLSELDRFCDAVEKAMKAGPAKPELERREA